MKPIVIIISISILLINASMWMASKRTCAIEKRLEIFYKIDSTQNCCMILQRITDSLQDRRHDLLVKFLLKDNE